MDFIREEAKNVEDAISQALKKLNINREDAEIKVIDVGNKGIFGLIGNKNAVVEVRVKKDLSKIGKDFLSNILSKISLNSEVEIAEDNADNEQLLYNIKSPDLGIIIGHRGDTLDALQYLTSLVINRESDTYYRVLLDAGGYREKRKNTLKRLALRLARKALDTGRKVVLEPMPPHERRIIHITLRNDSRVTTFSEGNEPYRRVMILANDSLDNN
jgi:spoIIIJ-associated protein